MILEMRKDIQVVEERLGRVGVGCGRGVVGGKVKGLGSLVGGGEVNGNENGRDRKWGVVARVKVLGMCGVEVGRLLKRSGGGHKNGDLVLAAKVLVLSRLLIKSVGDAEWDGLEEMKRKLGGLRRRLLRAVERTLVEKSGGDEREEVVQALAAYSLATSSGAKDVLRHFLHVRGEAIALAFEEDEDGKKAGKEEGVLKALELYIGTLLDVQALVPRRLEEALKGLKKKALLKDEAVRGLEGLRLDVCEKWFGEEILHFTPYIRHDDLDVAQAAETLKGWAKRASEVLLQGLGQSLDRTTEFKKVVQLRTRILEIWIKEGGKAKGFDPSILLDGLRGVVNDRMVELLETKIAKLHLVGTEIEATLGSWRAGITDKYESLWNDSMLEQEINNGATLFKQRILACTYGRNDSVSRVYSGYQTWRHLVDEIITFIEQLKKQRWDNDLEDIEDDLSLESRSKLLSQEDPQMLQDRLESSLERNYKELHDKISALLTTYEEDEQIGQISIYVLRVIRDIRAELPKNPSLRSFGLSLVPSLHEKLANTVSSDAVEAYSKTFSRKRVPGRALWEGSPELPVQPSPATFKFFRNLSLEMGKAGSDLWSPNAVKVLKHHLRVELNEHWISQLKSNQEETKVDDTKVNGEAETEKEDDEETAKRKREVLVQSLFDLFVLRNSLSVNENGDELENVASGIEAMLDLDVDSKKRMQQSAREYWRRAGLLFGLLA